jgi:AAA15 family ATPase/GTPase
LGKKAGKKNCEALCSSVLYGPNASGKTNLISAMDTFKSIVLRGNIHNNGENGKANALELIPNNLNTDIEPVTFSISFVEKGLLIEYAFSAVLGSFLETDYPRKITFEELKVNKKQVFLRTNELIFGSINEIRPYLLSTFEKNKDIMVTLAASSLNPEELFLANGFKTMVSAEFTALIRNWLENQLVIVCRADAIKVIRRFPNHEQESITIDSTLMDAIQCFGAGLNRIGYQANDAGTSTRLVSIFEDSKTKGAIVIPSEHFESYGTIRFVNLFPLIVEAMLHGQTLIIDEFDASIHPMALMSIVNIFHNDEVNINKAQLVFNTHNPIFLNANLMRRDEIKFIERDVDTLGSVHYSLSDFGTSGKNGVRKGEDYLRKYFMNRYGAVQNVDFQPIFEAILNIAEEVQ